MCCQAELGAQVKQNQQDFARTGRSENTKHHIRTALAEGEMLFHFHSNQIACTDQG